MKAKLDLDVNDEIRREDLLWAGLFLIAGVSLLLGFFTAASQKSVSSNGKVSMVSTPSHGGGGGGYPSNWGGAQWNYEWGWDNYANGYFYIEANFQYNDYHFLTSPSSIFTSGIEGNYATSLGVVSGGQIVLQGTEQQLISGWLHTNVPGTVYTIVPSYYWDNITVNGITVQQLFVSTTAEFQGSDFLQTNTDDVQISVIATANGQVQIALWNNGNTVLDYQTVTELLKYLYGD
ncbi:MAG: hypothetical protein ACYDAZ_05985 [Thermoplasmataceae archaeon]